MLSISCLFVLTRINVVLYARHTARAFNFALFPHPYQNLDKRFVCQSSSILFLASHNFDFNKFVYKGKERYPIHQVCLLNVKEYHFCLAHMKTLFVIVHKTWERGVAITKMNFPYASRTNHTWRLFGMLLCI